ncbi:MAG TPA: fused MFS/spermidine synthase [Pyrinomonadaceae bacterium]|nr:fused MFS/spermidine synthase [Pyrinomonadaceae bacterium]
MALNTASEVSVASNQITAYSRSTIVLIGLCFILSGATGLIYEVLWARMLGLVFGATTLAVSTVLAAFMGGLALGSALAGKLAQRIRKPLSVYGLMEILIALYALLVPLLFRWIDHVYALIWQQLQPGYFTFSLWRFFLSGVVLLVPTTLMGATLPVLAAALIRSSGRDSNSVTRLYACNLVGAILGTLAAGFVLLPWLGVRTTIAVAAALNIIVGAIAIFLQRKAQSHAEVLQEVEVEDSAVVDDGRGFWFFAALVSGFVTIGTQVSWTRVLTMIIGSSTYAFSIVVALFLIGLAIGAWIVARKDRAHRLRSTILVVEVLTAVSLLFSLYVLNAIPALLINLGLRFQVASWIGLLALQILSATLLILVPAVLMGMVMPLVLVWASSEGKKAVARVGRSYAINTVGAIAGAFLTGFIFIPKASTRFTLLFAATCCLVVAGLAYRPITGDPALKRSLAIGLSFVFVILLFVVAPRMNLADLSIGAYDSLVRVIAQTREGVQEGDTTAGPNIHELLMYQEGPTATVSVRRDADTVSMAINGRTNASDSIYDMPTQVMLGQLPLLIAPRIDNGLIIGYATGVTVGAMLQSPIQSVTCVELEPGTVAGSEFFNHINNRPLDDPRTTLIIDDARTFLRVTPNRYDIIVSEPSHPWVPGVANLFTQEFFELGRARLKDDGIWVQWVQIYQLSTESLRSVLATYHKVFPHVLVFRVGGLNKGKDLLLIGSNRPLNLDRLAERMADQRITAELARVNLKSEADVRGWFVCDESKLGPAVAGAKINTDDNMHIEMTVPRETFRPLMQNNAEWVQALAK